MNYNLQLIIQIQGKVKIKFRDFFQPFERVPMCPFEEPSTTSSNLFQDSSKWAWEWGECIHKAKYHLDPSYHEP